MPENGVFKICIPHTGRDSFDYLGGSLHPVAGSRVWVPFRKQNRMGIVLAQGLPEKPGLQLKSIGAVIDEQPLFSLACLDLCRWVSRYYQSSLSEVLPLAMPKKLREGNPAVLPVNRFYYLKTRDPSLLPAKLSKVHALYAFFSQQKKPVSKKILSKAGFSKVHLDKLLATNTIAEVIDLDLPEYEGQGGNPPLELNSEQAMAVEKISAGLHAYHCFLLQGVTGSGKTEVYLHLIAKVLAENRQVLVLVPEIGLTPQLLARFSARFATIPMVVLHSALSESSRTTAWLAARDQRVKLVIGTRSAIFTPMPALGLIIIDEEHDSSLKQMEGVRYSARDTALVRAQQSNIPVLLGSATPSLESMHNVERKKYTLLRLNQKAMNSTPLHYQLVDLRNHPLNEGLAAPTLEVIKTHLNDNNQVLVFINRRGFAPVLLCHSCGWMVDCRACDSHLTMHKSRNRLLCHHCGLSQTIPIACKHCQGRELIPIGTGTQRIYDYLRMQFPQTAMVRIDRDEVKRKNELDARLEQINKGEAQLIVGTQMLAKGHHFPSLTLVVVVDTDFGFYNQDFRALEQLGQLLTQVAGRAGRAEHPGQVVIQTHLPHHPLLNTLIKKGYDDFANAVLSTRKEAALPPYHFLALLRAESREHNKIVQFLQAIKDRLPNHSVQVLGPVPAPLARKAHQHRMQLLFKAPSRKQLHTALTGLTEFLNSKGPFSGIRWNIDVDPHDLS